jgi:hypothetical protein
MQGDYMESGSHTHECDEAEYLAAKYLASLFFAVENDLETNMEELFDCTLVELG